MPSRRIARRRGTVATSRTPTIDRLRMVGIRAHEVTGAARKAVTNLALARTNLAHTQFARSCVLMRSSNQRRSRLGAHSGSRLSASSCRHRTSRCPPAAGQGTRYGDSSCTPSSCRSLWPDCVRRYLGINHASSTSAPELRSSPPDSAQRGSHRRDSGGQESECRTRQFAKCRAIIRRQAREDSEIECMFFS